MQWPNGFNVGHTCEETSDRAEAVLRGCIFRCRNFPIRTGLEIILEHVNSAWPAKHLGELHHTCDHLNMSQGVSWPHIFSRLQFVVVLLCRLKSMCKLISLGPYAASFVMYKMN